MRTAAALYIVIALFGVCFSEKVAVGKNKKAATVAKKAATHGKKTAVLAKKKTKDEKPSVGNAATLTEDGYQEVAIRKSDEEMKLFIRRTLTSIGREVADEGELSGFAPHFSGVQAVQDFGKLREELGQAAWTRAMEKNIVAATQKKRTRLVKKHAAVVAPAVADKQTALRGRSKTIKTKAKATHVSLAQATQPVKQDSEQPHPQAQGEEKSNETQPAAKAQLPEVTSVMGKASGALSEFTSHAKAMQDRLAAKQAASRTALIAEKAKYKMHLDAQKVEVATALKATELLRANISKTMSVNTNLAEDAQRLQAGIKTLRSAGTTLMAKTAVALDFLGESINMTDESNDSPELSVLHPTTPKPDLDYFLGQARKELGLKAQAKATDADDEEDDSAFSSLLQVQVTEEEENLVSLLSESLAKLEKADAKARDMLKKQFDKLSTVEQGKLEDLEVMKEKLEAELGELVERRESLDAAKLHLQGLYTQMETRLHGLSVFSKKVDAAMAETLAAAAI